MNSFDSPLATPLLHSLHVGVWQEDPRHGLVPVGAIPPALAELFPALRTQPLHLESGFDFLRDFLTQAREHWEKPTDAPLRSPTWIEVDVHGTSRPLHAFALLLNEKRVLAVQLVDQLHAEKQEVLQSAREGMLALERLEQAQSELRASEQKQRELALQLDLRVQERTQELEASNEQLKLEVRERFRTQEQLLAYQDELRLLAQRVALAEEQERRRIADGLHDDLGQALALVKIQLGQVSEQAPEATVNQLAGIRDLVEQAIATTRTLTFELCSPILYEFGLAPALAQLVTQFESQHGIRSQFDEQGTATKLEQSMEVLLYQAIRELLHNVRKHAEAERVQLLLCWSEDELEIQVEDNGRGLGRDDVTTPSGFGLFSVQERLEHLGGSFFLESQAGEGTKAVLRVPLTETKTAPGESIT